MAGKATIGGKIVLEGEAEYRAALKNISSEQKELRSEMKLSTSEFKENQNSMDALKERHEILTKQIEQQTKKVEIYSKAMGESEEKQKKAETSVSLLADELEQAQKEMTKMSTSSDVSKEALDEQQKKVEELKNKLALAKDEYEKTTQKTMGWNTSLNNAKAELNGLDDTLKKNDQYMDEAEKSADGCATSINKYGKEAQEAAGESDKFGTKSKEAIGGLAEVIAAAGIAKGLKEIAGSLKECTDEAAAFETAVAKVSTVADSGKSSLENIKNGILGVSGELGVSAENIANATYNAISASVDTAKAVEFAGDATKLAVGGFTDSTTAVDILTTTINAYKMSINDTQKISDMLVTTQNLGKTTVNELAASMGKVIPIASTYNVGMNNLSASYAALTANGIATTESTTYLKGMLNELGDSGSVVSKKLRDETGQSFATLMGSGKSLGDVIDILGTSVQNDAGKFNELWSSSEAGVGALSLLSTGGDKFNEILYEMDNSAGATEEAFGKMADTTEQSENRMNTSLQNLKIAIGDELSPALENLYETGADAFTWATDFVNENPEVVNAIAALMAGLAVVTVGIGVATVGVKFAKVAMNELTLAMAANPAILLATAIAGITVALGAFIATAPKANDETNKLIEKHKESTSELQKNIDKRKLSEEEHLHEVTTIQKLKDEVIALNEKESLSTDEKNKLALATNELNQVMPELNLSINEQTGYLHGSTEEIEKNIEAMLHMYDVQFMEEDLKEIAKDRYEEEKNLAELTMERTKKQEELAQAESDYNDWLIKNKDSMQEYTSQYAANGVSQGEYSTKLMESKAAVEALDEQMNISKETINGLEQNFQNVTTSMDKAKESMDVVGDATISYKDKTYEVTPEVAASIGTIQTAYNEAKAAALDSLKTQVGLFDELSIKSDLTAQEMAKSLDSQTVAFTTYKDDMLAASALVQDGLMDEGLLGSIQALGMDGAGYLHELVTSAASDSESYAEVMKSFGNMEVARESLADTMGDIQEDYTVQLDSILGINTEKYEQMAVDTEEIHENIQVQVEEAMKKLKTTTGDGISDLGKEVTLKTPDVVKAGDTLCTSVVAGVNTKLNVVDGKSLVFANIGMTITASMAQGILDGRQKVISAMQSVIDSAVNAIDMSGITSKINKALGDAF
ncbi:MAG: phage tail tape measure protein [Flavobacterium sp.]